MQQRSGNNKSSGISSRATQNQVTSIEGRDSHAKFRHGLLQLMIHTIDPLHDGQLPAGIPLFFFNDLIYLRKQKF